MALIGPGFVVIALYHALVVRNGFSHDQSQRKQHKQDLDEMLHFHLDWKAWNRIDSTSTYRSGAGRQKFLVTRGDSQLESLQPLESIWKIWAAIVKQP